MDELTMDDIQMDELNRLTYQRLKDSGQFQTSEWVVISSGELIYRGTSEREALKVASRAGTRCYWAQVDHEDAIEIIG